MNYKDLNDKQSEAVFQTEGPLLILAGAGSGKTKVVTNKIAYLIENKDIYPSNILAITFTNKAANEMKERVRSLIDVDVESMWIGTFHSICLRILRRNIEMIGYGSNFSIYDRDDQVTIIKEAIKELNLNIDNYKPSSIISTISSLKNDDILPDDYIKENYIDFYKKNIGEVYELYEKKLKENNALDFDDLIIKTVKLLNKSEELRSYYQRKFRYVFVDEYQDTNAMQYKFIRAMCSENPNITVVGDNDQSIYAWRGADITNILNFEKDFENAKVILLEQNYRSKTNILDAANSLIKNNSNRKDKNLWSNRGEGEKVQYEIYSHNYEEEMGVVNKIQEMRYKGYNFDEMAILYRTNAQSRGFEEVLMREKIAYKIVGGLRFYDRKEVKDIVAYLKLIQNLDDDLALSRIINVPKRGIGAQSIADLKEFADKKGVSLFNIISNLKDYEDLNLRARKNIENFSSLINLLKNKSEDMSISELIEEIIYQSGYEEDLKRENTTQSRTRIENIKEFISTALDYERKTEDGSLEDFLSGISLLSDVDKTKDESHAVSLMTIHSAKGLEFKIVFLVGMEEKLFPTSRAIDEEDDVEEERRLCYVAITRAMDRLFISSSQNRTLYGRTSPSLESRFINEMKDFIDIKEAKENEEVIQNRKLVIIKEFTSYESKKREESKKIKAKNNLDVDIGDKIIHKKWGEGMIVSKTPKEEDYEVVVSFEGKGLKRLMLSLAPISLVK